MIEVGGKKLMTKAEYSRFRGVSDSAVSKAIKSNRVVCVPHENQMWVDVEASEIAWQQNTDFSQTRTAEQTTPLKYRDENDPKPTEPKLANFADARAQRERIEARIRGLELERRLGKLINADEVATQAYADGRKVRNAMRAIPDRLAPILAAETDVHKLHTMLLREIDNVLEGLSRELGESQRHSDQEIR